MKYRKNVDASDVQFLLKNETVKLSTDKTFKMKHASNNITCWKNRGCVKTFFSLAVVILLAYILIDALPVNSQSVRAFRENYKNNVDAPPKVRTVKKNSNERVSDGVRSKILLRNKHQTLIKPTSEITTT